MNHSHAVAMDKETMEELDVEIDEDSEIITAPKVVYCEMCRDDFNTNMLTEE